VLDRVIAADPHGPDTLFSASQLAGNLDRASDAQRLIDLAVEIRDDAATLLRASRILGSIGKIADAKALAERSADARGADRPGVRFEIGKLLLAHGEIDRGTEMMLDAADRLGHDRWQRLGVAFALTQIGHDAKQPALTEQGLAVFGDLVGEHPDEPIFRHDFAGWLFTAGRRDEAVEQIVAAAEIAKDSDLLADRAAQLLDLVGRGDEANMWKKTAESRRSAISPLPVP
ncbi:MAG: hypothetical protein K8E66_02640, partial [Phycisphaerales bacterium]|nr:hypothetical protein [Phycisphaerales bacterium]